MQPRPVSLDTDQHRHTANADIHRDEMGELDDLCDPGDLRELGDMRDLR